MKFTWSLTSVVVFRPDPSRSGSRAWQKWVTRGLLLQRTSSDWKATATNRMHSNDLEACGMLYRCFWFHSEVKFFRITEEGSVPEMRIWSILSIISDLKWCIHLSRSLFLYFTRFRHLCGLVVILPYFNAISVDFYAGKCLIYIYFV